MKRDDLLVSLGGVSAAAAGPTDALRAVAALVGRSEGVQLAVVVTRGAERKELMLTPRSGWGGRGLLGCVRLLCFPVARFRRARRAGRNQDRSLTCTGLACSCHIVPHAS